MGDNKKAVFLKVRSKSLGDAPAPDYFTPLFKMGLYYPLVDVRKVRLA